MRQVTTKIIFTVTNDLSYDQRMIRICSALAKNGFEVLLVGRVKKDSIPLKNQAFQQKRLQLRFHQGKLFYLEYNLRLFFFLLKNKCHIIGSIDLDSLLPCFLVSKIKNTTCVFDAHEYFTEVPEVVDRPFTKKIWASLAQLIIPRLEHAYTVSASLQDLFSKKYGVPFGLIRNIASYKAPKEPVHHAPNKNAPTILLYQGVLNEGRGLEAMINAMPYIENAHLWLAGEGDLSTALRRQVQALNLEQRVIFLGYLQPPELKKITQKAQIGLNLLENRGLSYYYSLANKTFDYIQAEIPALHPDFPEYRKINADKEIGILVKDLEVETLVIALNKLINDKMFYQQIKQNCRAQKGIYTWENEANKLFNIYNKLKVN